MATVWSDSYSTVVSARLPCVNYFYKEISTGPNVPSIGIFLHTFHLLGLDTARIYHR